jgi:DNA-binding GntR family transcriptional regulator
MSLDPDSGVPFYQQLYDLLRDQIVSGKLHGRMPSSRSLHEEYGVSHATSDRALVMLRDEGLIKSSRGLGYFTVRKGQG